jgi:3-oxoadipate enol-lactonase
MPYFDLGPQLKIHYLDLKPPGKPILLLHGLGASCDSWLLQSSFLIEHGYRILAPDIPGFGKSTYPGGSTSIQKLAGFIGEWINCIDVVPLSVVGISMGGVIALELALDFPEYIDKMVLISAFAHLEIFKPQTLPYFLLRYFLIQVFGLRSQAGAVAKRVFPNPEHGGYREEFIRQIGEADPIGYRAVMQALARFNVENRLSQVLSPVLIITGEGDTTVLPECQTKLAQNLPNARQVIIPNAGHAVSIDQPVLLNNILNEFLTD